MSLYTSCFRLQLPLCIVYPFFKDDLDKETFGTTVESLIAAVFMYVSETKLTKILVTCVTNLWKLTRFTKVQET